MSVDPSQPAYRPPSRQKYNIMHERYWFNMPDILRSVNYPVYHLLAFSTRSPHTQSVKCWAGAASQQWFEHCTPIFTNSSLLWAMPPQPTGAPSEQSGFVNGIKQWLWSLMKLYYRRRFISWIFHRSRFYDARLVNHKMYQTEHMSYYRHGFIHSLPAPRGKW